MPSVVVKKKIDIPMIGTWKWSKEAYAVPLTFRLHGVQAQLRLSSYELSKPRDRDIVWEADLSLEFTNPTSDFLRGLKTSGKLAQNAAEAIYALYLQVYEQFEGVLRTVGGIKNLHIQPPISLDSFFTGDGLLSGSKSCMWCIDGGDNNPFFPKLSKVRKGLNPLFKSDQIISIEKWKRLQLAIDNHDFPSPELVELLRIKSQLQWRDKKIPTIEAAILVETLLREYASKALTDCGFSKNRVKALRGELTFNTFLNIVLPLSLKKRDAARMEEHIRKVDLLRKVRNDVVHGNITAEDIDEQKVRNGIEGALSVVEFIRKKIHSA